VGAVACIPGISKGLAIYTGLMDVRVVAKYQFISFSTPWHTAKECLKRTERSL